MGIEDLHNKDKETTQLVHIKVAVSADYTKCNIFGWSGALYWQVTAQDT